jgi:hypothetical protein
LVGKLSFLVILGDISVGSRDFWTVMYWYIAVVDNGMFGMAISGVSLDTHITPLATSPDVFCYNDFTNTMRII